MKKRSCTAIGLLAISSLACSTSSSLVQIRFGDRIEDVASVSSGAYEAYLTAQLALERGDEATAIANLETAISFDPDSVYLHVHLAEIHARRGRSAAAQQYLDGALRLDPDHPEALVLQGRLYWHQGKQAKAAAALRRAMIKNPTLPTAYLLYAEFLESQNHSAEARAVLEQLTTKVSDTSEGHSGLAMLCLRQFDYGCAAQHFRQALEDDAEPETLARLAHVQRSTGDLRSAVRSLREAFDRSGGSVSVASALIEVLQQMGDRQAIDDLLAVMEGDIEENPAQIGELAGLCLEAHRPERALKLLDAQLKRRGNSTLHIERAEALVLLGRTNEAKTLLRQELTGARAATAAIRLARLLQHQGSAAEASAVLRQTLRQEPNNYALVIALSTSLQVQGQPAASVQVIREALARHPADRTLQFGLGAALERIGQWREAVEVMRGILTKHPNDPAVHNFIGFALVDHGGELKTAEQSIRKALALNPGEGYIIDSLGWLYYRQGKLAEARQVLQMAVRLAPREPEVLAHLAEAEAARSDMAGAVRLLKQAVTVSEDLSLTAKLKKRLHDLEKGRVGAR